MKFFTRPEGSFTASLAALARRLRLDADAAQPGAPPSPGFFDDTATFATLRCVIIPNLAERHAVTHTLRVWSAGCGAGQITYSLAILFLQEGLEDWNIRILGTDGSLRLIERAARGRYSDAEVRRGLPDAALRRHFDRAGRSWIVKPSVREMVHFLHLDAGGDMALMGPFDLVLSRDPVPAIGEAISSGGFLIPGHAAPPPGLHQHLYGSSVFYQVPERVEA